MCTCVCARVHAWLTWSRQLLVHASSRRSTCFWVFEESALALSTTANTMVTEGRSCACSACLPRGAARVPATKRARLRGYGCVSVFQCQGRAIAREQPAWASLAFTLGQLAKRRTATRSCSSSGTGSRWFGKVTPVAKCFSQASPNKASVLNASCRQRPCTLQTYGFQLSQLFAAGIPSMPLLQRDAIFFEILCAGA